MPSVSSDQIWSDSPPSDKPGAPASPNLSDGVARVVLRLPDLNVSVPPAFEPSTAGPTQTTKGVAIAAAGAEFARACWRTISRKNVVWSCVVAMLLEFALAGFCTQSRHQKPPRGPAPRANEAAAEKPIAAVPTTVVAPPAPITSDGANHGEWLSGSATIGLHEIGASDPESDPDNPRLDDAQTDTDNEPAGNSADDSPESIRLAERTARGADRVSGGAESAADDELVRLKAIEPIDDADLDASAGGSDR